MKIMNTKKCVVQYMYMYAILHNNSMIVHVCHLGSQCTTQVNVCYLIHKHDCICIASCDLSHGYNYLENAFFVRKDPIARIHKG